MGQARRRGSFEQRQAELWTQYGVKPLTPERYNAYVAWTRTPIASFLGEELEFFSSSDEVLVGVILLDTTDRDFAFVTLGRDEKGRFRAIDCSASLTRTEARHLLFASIKRHGDSRSAVFPQGDADDKAGVDLFQATAPRDKLHPSFKLLNEGDHWIPAKSIMSEMMRHFRDVDGNFVEQFQTTGFDSRIWELYLYAALLELGLFVEKPNPAPDFCVKSGRKQVFIEAVTVNPSAGEPKVEPSKEGLMRSPEEILELLKGKAPIKFGSALYSKLNRKKPYWELDDVKGKPLVFAIADFHESQSMTWTSPALLQYLYGVSHDFVRDEAGQLVISPIKLEAFEFEGKKIPAGFFLLPGSENVSAILFSSSGTLSKFNRMGRLAGFGLANQHIFRWGLHHKHDLNSALPEPFLHDVRQGITTETWAEGLSMFHNPQARHPVDHRIFPSIAHHRYVDGQIESLLPDFHPYTSYTWNLLAVDDETFEKTRKEFESGINAQPVDT
ncbi:hypothetical protein [Polaromonas sp.]|uniref:hypothetical protein n=1 Tax=Polaromonas sp. TaxID=1869339 RepID=UPI003264FE45